MANLIKIFMAHQKKNKERAKNFKFYRGCMAAAAFIASADGVVEQSERIGLKALMQSMDELKMYSTRQGLEIFDEFIIDLKTDGDEGYKKVMNAVKEVSGDSDWAELLVAMAATISEADGLVEEPEISAIREIGELLGIDSETIDSINIDMVQATHNNLH